MQKGEEGAMLLTGKPAPAELRMTVFAANAEAAANRYTSVHYQ